MNEITILSELWRIKIQDPSDMNDNRITFCCKIATSKIQNAPFIIYFDENVKAISWDQVVDAKESYELVRRHIFNQQELIRVLLVYLNTWYRWKI